MLDSFAFPAVMCEKSNLSASLPAHSIVNTVSLTILLNMRRDFTVVLKCSSLMANDLEHLFMCLSAVSTAFWDSAAHLLPVFVNYVLTVYFWQLSTSLCILDIDFSYTWILRIQVLCQLCDVQIFLQKLLDVDTAQFINVFHYTLCFWCHVSRPLI